MKYRVLLHKSDKGYFAVSPNFPTCNALGATAEEALETVQDLIQDVITVREGLRWDFTPGADEIRAVDVEVKSQKEISLQYEIKMIKHAEGFSVSCPMLPGCFSQGETIEEGLANIQIAIREWLIVAQEVLLLGEPDITIVEIDDEDEAAA